MPRLRRPVKADVEVAGQCRITGVCMIIDMRKAVLLLPIYVAWMVGTDLLFNSSGVNTSNDLPLWLIIGFTIMACS